MGCDRAAVGLGKPNSAGVEQSGVSAGSTRVLRKILSTARRRGILGLFAAVMGKLSRRGISHCELYFRTLNGKRGLEIGGPSAAFKEGGILPVYPIVAHLDGCNFSSTTVWEGQIEAGLTYEYHKGSGKGFQLICEAGRLDRIESESYDFVLASHVLEHIANPIKAMSEWLRVLKSDGTLVLVLPHKEATFDHRRPVTTMAHLLEDFEKNTDETDLSHLPEILELHDLSLDPEVPDQSSFRNRCLKNYENRCLHHHVFDTDLGVAIFNHFNLQILSVDPVLPINIFIMGKKVPSLQALDNCRFLDEHAEWRLRSPFMSDRR